MSGPEQRPDAVDDPREAPVQDAFDDALGLAGRSLDGVDLVSFHGRSGSGKSSAIRFLLEEHPDLQAASGAARRDDVTVFDDLLSPRQGLDILQALQRGRRGHRVLAACHFPRRWLAPLRLRWRVVSFDLDAHPAKIDRWLTARGIDHTPGAVTTFCRHFGANYTDAAIILERFPDRSFDQALSRFMKECRIE